MSAIKLSIQCLVYYTVFVVLVAANKDQNDYSLDTTLHLAGNCEKESMKQKCQQKCGENHGCLLGMCFCLKQADKQIYVKKLNHEMLTAEDRFLDFDDYTEMTPTLLYKPDEGVHKTELRHHIAHFCPSIEEASKCIRGCMKLGKPAFCGKDHVCYCGHRYKTPDNGKKVDPANIYSQYQDLYKKYFGTQVDSEEDH